MDSVVLVMEPLTREMIAGGATMVAGLDAAGFPPRSAFWVWRTETPQWVLYLVFPEDLGARSLDVSIECTRLSQNNPAFEESWNADYQPMYGESKPFGNLIAALRTNDERPGPDGKPVRVRSVFGKDVFIDFALIYRLD